MQFCFRR